MESSIFLGPTYYQRLKLTAVRLEQLAGYSNRRALAVARARARARARAAREHMCVAARAPWQRGRVGCAEPTPDASR